MATNGVEREEVVLIDCETTKPTSIRFTNVDQKKKKEVYNPVKRYRQDQRTRHTYTLQREAWKMKTLTDDDVLVVIRSKEREEDKKCPKKTPDEKEEIRPLQAYTTSRDLWYAVGEAVPSASPLSRPVEPAPPSENSDEESFFLMARNSPSKQVRRVKPTARSGKMLTEKSCAICTVRWNSQIDRALHSPGIGCDGFGEDHQPCPYWVHACCLGQTDARQEDFVGREFFCPKHNPTKKNIEEMLERNKLKSKKRKSTKK